MLPLRRAAKIYQTVLWPSFLGVMVFKIEGQDLSFKTKTKTRHSTSRHRRCGGIFGGRGWIHSIGRPWVHISFPLIHMIYLSKSVSVRPGYDGNFHLISHCFVDAVMQRCREQDFWQSRCQWQDFHETEHEWSRGPRPWSRDHEIELGHRSWVDKVHDNLVS